MRAAKVPARMMPAEVMTVPVRAEAMVMPVAQVPRRALLAHAAHEEDVVVGPERHEQHEDDERHEVVQAVLAQDPLEDQGGHAHRGPEAEQHAADQVERRHEAAQQQHEHDEDADDGDEPDELEVLGGGGLDVRGCRGRATHVGRGDDAQRSAWSPGPPLLRGALARCGSRARRPVGQQGPHPAHGLERRRAVGLVGRHQAELAGAAIGREVGLQEEPHRRVAGSRGRDEEVVRSGPERLRQAAQLGRQPGRHLDGAGQGIGALRRPVGRRLVGGHGVSQRGRAVASLGQALVGHVRIGRRERVEVAKRAVQPLQRGRIGQRGQGPQQVTAELSPSTMVASWFDGRRPTGHAAVADRCRQRTDGLDAFDVTERLADPRDLRQAGRRAEVHALRRLQEHADRQQLAAVEVGRHRVEATTCLRPWPAAP